MPEKTFKHSGNLADIIYSLPAVRDLGGGTLFLDINTGRTRLDRAAFDTIHPLLLEQPYIRDVQVWNHEPIDVDLDGARDAKWDPLLNLSVRYLRHFSLSEDVIRNPWLMLKSPPITPRKNLLLSRTTRWQAKYHLWEMTKSHWLTNGVFVGLPIEHKWFEHTFDCKIEFHPTQDALEIARVLRGAAKLVANQGFIASIANGLGMPLVLETYDPQANCIFPRENFSQF